MRGGFGDRLVYVGREWCGEERENGAIAFDRRLTELVARCLARDKGGWPTLVYMWTSPDY